MGKLAGLSERTGREIIERGDGPRIVQLSPNRIGIQVCDHREWLAARTRRASNGRPKFSFLINNLYSSANFSDTVAFMNLAQKARTPMCHSRSEFLNPEFKIPGGTALTHPAPGGRQRPSVKTCILSIC